MIMIVSNKTEMSAFFFSYASNQLHGTENKYIF